MKSWVAPAGLVLVLGGLSIGVPAAWCGANAPTSHDDAFSEAGLLTCDAGALRSTVVTPHVAVPVQGRNVLWCGTFQLAWNELRARFGGAVRFAPPEPAMVRVLNTPWFTRGDLDAASYVAVADFVRNGVHDRIAAALAKTFHGRAAPRFLPRAELTERPQDVVAYAYLFKHLEFVSPFERIEAPLQFGGVSVPCFGLGDAYKPGHARLLGQVSILHHADANEFIVELKTRSPGDRLILARIPPGPTLGATVDAAAKLVAAGTPVAPQAGDALKVPKLNFDVTRRYQELLGRRLRVASPAVAKDLEVGSAVQNIRFQLDEEGVRLESESHVGLSCSAAAPAPGTRRLIFDAPFLLLMQRVGAPRPYFALWVHDAELLVKAGGE